jgi:GntR family transcriptional repressor for pyruvate dehydrogenase complex
MKELASTKVLQEMQQLIEGEEWKPGQKLPSLKQLAATLGAGISTVREALRILENKGYISIEQGRGMFVRSRHVWQDGGGSVELTPISMGSLFSLLEFRELLEPEIARLAAERATPGQIGDIKQAAEDMQAELRNRQDYFSSDLAFHDRIAEACSNDVMTQVMRGVSDLLLESLKRTTRIPGSAERAVHFHMLIALAIEQRNGKLAKQTMNLHLQDVRNDYQQLQEQG